MEKFILYKVKESDNISSIAQKFNLTERIIIKENALNKEVEQNQTLYIPILNGIVVIVPPFETLESLSKKYKCSQLGQINGVKRVFTFQKLLIMNIIQ